MKSEQINDKPDDTNNNIPSINKENKENNNNNTNLNNENEENNKEKKTENEKTEPKNENNEISNNNVPKDSNNNEKNDNEEQIFIKYEQEDYVTKMWIFNQKNEKINFKKHNLSKYFAKLKKNEKLKSAIIKN